jgi:hypothetical protein
VDLERFCQASQIPVRRRPDIWGDLLEPFLGAQPQLEAAALSRLHQAGLTGAEIDQIRAQVGPLMIAYNTFHRDWAHLGLADLLDATTTTLLPEDLRSGLGEIGSLYIWAMGVANRTGPQPAA